MARKNKEKHEGGGFTRTLAWTIVLALVFSAGLITGQRLLRADAKKPMVSLSSTRVAAEAAKAGQDGEATKSLRTTFSFYEHLTAAAPSTEEAPAGAEVAQPTVQKPAAEKPEAKPEKEPEEAPAAEPPEQPESDNKVEEPAPSEPAEMPANEQSEPDAPAQEPEKESTPPTEMLAKVVDSLRGTDADALPARYTLQVSSHPDRSSAEREMDRLRDAGVEPHVVVVEVPGKGKLWRIRVGKFHSMDEARAFQGSLKAKRGVPGFVTPL